MSETDVTYATIELKAWEEGLRGRTLTWARLEKTTGFSRQALSGKVSIKEAYDAAKLALRDGVRPRKPRSDEFLEDRIDGLERELARYKDLETNWLERWTGIAFHLRGKGLSIQDFDRPLPQAKRK